MCTSANVDVCSGRGRQAVSLLGDNTDESAAVAPQPSEVSGSENSAVVPSPSSSNGHAGTVTGGGSMSESSADGVTAAGEDTSHHASLSRAFWKPTLSVGLVYDHTVLKRSLFLAHMKDAMVVRAL